MAQLTRCDKCGDVIYDGLIAVMSSLTVKGNRASEHNHAIDLCDFCFLEFMVWLGVTPAKKEGV